MEKLKEFALGEEAFYNFMYALVPFDLTYGNKLLSHINNKKYKITLISDVKNLETYKCLNHAKDIDESREIMFEHEELDFEKD